MYLTTIRRWQRMIAVVSALGFLPLSAAFAQQIYKCTEAGRTTYSQLPCKGGEQQVLDATPPGPSGNPSSRANRERQFRAPSIETNMHPDARPRLSLDDPAERPPEDRSAAENRRRECEYAREKLDEARRHQSGMTSVNAAIAQVNAACNMNIQLIQPADIRTITMCDQFGCTDSKGTRFIGSNINAVSPDGKTCLRTGTSVTCR